MMQTIVPGSGPGLALLVAGLLMSALLTAFSIEYAARLRLIDLPGHRRSHAIPTPRGGGIGPVLVILGGGGWLASHDSQKMQAAATWLGGLAVVAAIGWVDDHRPLPAVLRLAVHVAAAIAAGVALCGNAHSPAQFVAIAVVVFAITSLVNIWNFMDGIDALAVSQAVLVVMTLLVGGWLKGAWQELGGLLLVSLLGFLPFNLPRARIFLGDVGSGAIGYLLACLLLHAVWAGGMPWPLAVLAVSAFLIDGGMTLLLRILQGKRWWRPHREHLYQWLVRSGYTHGQVTSWYAAWTAAAGVLAVASRRFELSVGLAVMSAAIISGALFWLGFRNRLCMTARRRHRWTVSAG
jgi:UDP-N-acetylmuramyl pentapeptide phosphotransferase/UDP-N-acetylglucosamine-1-phosphate transferase